MVNNLPPAKTVVDDLAEAAEVVIFDFYSGRWWRLFWSIKRLLKSLSAFESVWSRV